jgi:hypothetical protein
MAINGHELRTAIAAVIPNYAVDTDNDGQLVIYTNLIEVGVTDTFREMTEEDERG